MSELLFTQMLKSFKKHKQGWDLFKIVEDTYRAKYDPIIIKANGNFVVKSRENIEKKGKEMRSETAL